MSQSPFADATAHGTAMAPDEHGLDRSHAAPALVETSIPTDDYAARRRRAAAGRHAAARLRERRELHRRGNPVQQSPWPLDAGDGTVGGGWLRTGRLIGGGAVAGNGGALIAEDGLTWSPIPCTRAWPTGACGPGLRTTWGWCSGRRGRAGADPDLSEHRAERSRQGRGRRELVGPHLPVGLVPAVQRGRTLGRGGRGGRRGPERRLHGHLRRRVSHEVGDYGRRPSHRWNGRLASEYINKRATT